MLLSALQGGEGGPHGGAVGGGGGLVCKRSGIPRLTPTLSAPEGGEGVTAAMAVPAWVEVQLAVGGALKLARGDPSGLGFFDTSVDGFWRSFRAGVICYPFFLILLAFRVSAAHWAASGMAHIVIVETIGYVISWVAFPLLVLPLTRYLGRENRFIPFIVAYNWSQIPQTALFVIVGADAATGLFPSGVAQVVDFAAAVAVLVYEWYIARVALQVSTSQAVPVVLLDVVLGVVLSRITEGLY